MNFRNYLCFLCIWTNPLWSWRPWERAPELYQDFNQLNFISAAAAAHSPLGWIWDCDTAKGGGHLKRKKTPHNLFLPCAFSGVSEITSPSIAFLEKFMLLALSLQPGVADRAGLKPLRCLFQSKWNPQLLHFPLTVAPMNQIFDSHSCKAYGWYLTCVDSSFYICE